MQPRATYVNPMPALIDQYNKVTNEPQGKIAMVKEHICLALKLPVMLELLRTGTVFSPPPNPTAMPDDMFHNMTNPVVLIRHPALVVSSFWRAQHANFGLDVTDEGFEMLTMQRTSRFLVDHIQRLRKEASAEDREGGPIIIDAEDAVHRTESLCNKLCEILCIDLNGVRFTWDALPKEKRIHPLQPHFRGELDDSTGVVRPTETVSLCKCGCTQTALTTA